MAIHPKRVNGLHVVTFCTQCGDELSRKILVEQNPGGSKPSLLEAGIGMELFPEFCRLPMCIQAFQFRKFLHGGQCFFERGAGVFHHARAALELIHGQSGE